MRVPALVLAGAVLALSLAAPKPAEAWSRRAPAGWGDAQIVRNWGYYPRYEHVYSVDYATDPYAYRYMPSGYYPYYNSGYWRPAWVMRLRPRPHYRLPPYYQAWGYPDRTYNHAKWHLLHHGGHWHHHW
ncbi:MAG TPA: hypothetical protein VJ045_02715 [Hyphomicrobiaceae bacterium]|nr:hypothetical protein [Hyphomicrobiaceae bacterium]HLB07462.1 hypothetical protein [Alphaproteobacteria bacterium]